MSVSPSVDLNDLDPTVHSPSSQLLLDELLRLAVIRPEEWEMLPAAGRKELESFSDIPPLLAQLVECKLLTEFQAARVSTGRVGELILGNYRVLDCLGTGAMGAVLKAEHLRLRRPVAVKVMHLLQGQDLEASKRFYTEAWAVAQLQHPNIVSALDAGEITALDPAQPVLHYFVMEYVPGESLEQYVKARGPLPPPEACTLIYQVAAALAEAHKHHLVHRDIKPSNIQVTPECQAKLLDFGLARHFRSRLTEAGTVLGTVDFLAPEQARDAHAVDIRADIYGLGGTLFFCLTGRVPFPSRGPLHEALALRQSLPPPSVRVCRLEVPEELDRVVARMMALDPDDRFPTPQAVMRVLVPFVKTEVRETVLLTTPPPAPEPPDKTSAGEGGLPHIHGVLIVDDETPNRVLCRTLLESEGIRCDEADDGVSALEAVRQKHYDLLLLDVDMPSLNGTEVLRRLRVSPPCPHLKVIMVSGRTSGDEMAQMLLAGADDYLAKPFSLVQLGSRVKAALHLKDAQDRSDLLNRHLLAMNRALEENLHARNSDLVHARNALTLALADLVAYRDAETGDHLLRLQRYTRLLAEQVALLPAFAGQIDDNFITLLEGCAPLHDIGKVGVPDYILLKPGKLETDERVIMQTHTTIGAAVLEKVARRHGFAVAFLQLAADIARHHHERYDGTGYPDRLAGSSIPLAARILCLGDVYDALRSRRPYKPALSHAGALEVMMASTGQFDPALWQAFLACAPSLERVFDEVTG